MVEASDLTEIVHKAIGTIRKNTTVVPRVGKIKEYPEP